MCHSGLKQRNLAVFFQSLSNYADEKQRQNDRPKCRVLKKLWFERKAGARKGPFVK
jgi:hypothetical protein